MGGGTIMKYVLFNLKNETFGVPIGQVCEVLRKPSLSSLPDAPECMAGLIPVRKHSVLVMNLGERLRLAQAGASAEGRHVLVVNAGGLLLGLLVDEVRDVVDLDESQVDEREKFGMGQLRSELLRGVAQSGERPVFLLDLSHLLGARDREALQGGQSRL